MLAELEQLETVAGEEVNEASGLGYATMSVKSISDKATPDDPGRFFSGMLNAHTVDLEDEIYDPDGIDIRSFKDCGGPILNRHSGETTADGYSCVVARVLSISKRSDGLFITKAEFDTDPLSEHYKGKVHRGFLKAMSAGFLRCEVEYKKRADGRVIRVVKKSILIHGILTSQPVNRTSLIGRKSLDRVEELARQVEALKSGAVAPERIQELTESVKSLSDQLQAIQDALHSDRVPPVEASRVDALAASFASIANAAGRLAKAS